MNKVSISVLISVTLVFMCTPSQPSVDAVPPVVINEFMAANEPGGPVDEYGDADDWIELYNAGYAAVNVSDLYLSDDSLHLHAYSLPDTVVPPGGFLLIWADDEPAEGRWHAPFKLSWRSGDEIILTQGLEQQVDRYRFFPENDNPTARVPGTSFGRAEDGADLWGQQLQPTPGAANEGVR
jgi:hypothetical protein